MSIRRVQRTQTHNSLHGASWPAVWSRDQRLQCVAAILAEEGIDCRLGLDVPLNGAKIALALVRDITNDSMVGRSVRLAYFTALLEMELAVEAAELD